MQDRGLSEGDNTCVAEARVQPLKTHPAVFAEMNFVPGWVLYAEPCLLMCPRDAWNVRLAGDVSSGNLKHLASRREPEACGRSSNDRARRKCVQEVLPHVRAHAVQGAALAAQVFVERRHVGPKLGTSGGCPHEQPQQLLQGFAGSLGGACDLEQLLLKLGQLVRKERDNLEVQVVLPTAPVDAVPELGLAPTNWRVQACEQADEEASLLDECLFGQYGQQVVDIKPSLVRVAGQQGMRYAQQHPSKTLPPIRAELGPEVTDRVVKKLASVLEKQATLLVLPDLHAFVRSFEIQG